MQYRLSKHIVPVAYDLTLRPDLDDDSFEGNVKIKIKVGERTRQFAVHKGTDMVIEKAQILASTGDINLVRIRKWRR